MGNRFRLLINEVEAVEPQNDLPKPARSPRALETLPDMKTGCAAWIYAGGAHHTCLQPELNRRAIKVLW
jgi:L-arabinose isomerase